MRSITFWDILLLLESICYIVFMSLVALEFCSTSYSIDTSLGSEVRKTIYLFVFIGSNFRLISIISHVFLVFPDYCREFIIIMMEEITNLLFITGLSLQIVFLVQIYYALLGLSQPAIRRVFIFVIMCGYILTFILVFLSLFLNISFILNGIHFVIATICTFCLFSLIIYGRQIYNEMKRISVSHSIICKMIIILAVSSVTFFIRALIEILYSFDIIKLEYDTNGNVHFIGSNLYQSAMYFSFFYFLTEIFPLSILLISTYIRNKAPIRTVDEQSYSRPGQSYELKSQPKYPLFRMTTDVYPLNSNQFDDSQQSLLTPYTSLSSISIQLPTRFNSKKQV